jgi:hypothetical protein
MSSHAPIHTYRSEVDQIRRFSGSVRETTVRRAVFNLINAYARPRDLLLCEELAYSNPRRHNRRVTQDYTLPSSLPRLHRRESKGDDMKATAAAALFQ